MLFNINRLVKKKRDSDLKYGIDLPNDSKSDDCYVFPSGMYIFKDVASPWSIAFSKSQRRNYFYKNRITDLYLYTVLLSLFSLLYKRYATLQLS